MPKEWSTGKIYEDSNGNDLPNNRFRWGMGYAAVGTGCMLFSGILLGMLVVSTVIATLLALLALFGAVCVWRGLSDKPLWVSILVLVLLGALFIGGLRKQYNDRKSETQQKQAVVYQNNKSL